MTSLQHRGTGQDSSASSPGPIQPRCRKQAVWEYGTQLPDEVPRRGNGGLTRKSRNGCLSADDGKADGTVRIGIRDGLFPGGRAPFLTK